MLGLFNRNKDKVVEEEKQNTFILGGGAGHTPWKPTDVKKYVNEGYKFNLIVFRCVKEVADSVASVPVEVGRLDNQGTFIAEPNRPASRLLRRPNPMTARSALIRELISYYLITGDTFLNSVGNREPAELWVRRPDLMHVVPGQFKVPRRYEYRIGSQVLDSWDVDPRTAESEILHIKTFNPLNDLRGMPPLQAAAINVDQHNEGDRWYFNLLKEGSVLPGILKTDKPLSDNLFNRIKKEIKEKWSGSKNAGETPLLQGGLDFQSIGLSPQQMLIEKGKESTARFICQAFGVPPHLLGLPDGATFNNFGESRMYMWDTTIIPLTDWVYEELALWLGRKFNDPDLVIRPDYDRVPALEPRREKLWDRLKNVTFLTDDEKRIELGYEPLGDGAAVLYRGAGEIPVTGDQAVDFTGGDSEEEETDPNEED